jgi:septal ring factor EnvC (AmiA/AmiB activator)
MEKTKMNDERQEVVQVNEGTPRWLGIAVVALAAVSLLALGVGWSASNHAREAQTATENDAKVLRQNLDVVTQRLSQAEAINSQVQGDLSVVTDRLKLTQTELDKSRHQATQIRTQYSKQLTEMQDKVQSTEAELQNKASNDDVRAVSTDVNGVKTDLDATKQGLLQANGLLTEHGTQIARNHDELEQLRRLGQRDYIEFTIATKGTKEKVGNVSLELRGVNVKHNQYTVALYVDDLRLEKKNRAVNEPIFFYTRGSRASMELVVNSVGKDKIVGYLSVPKVQSASAGASSSGSN